jgi:hypothetical protein
MEREAALLELWDAAAGAAPWERDDILLRAAGTTTEELGARNAALLGLRARFFGNRWPLAATCPACGASCEFEVDCTEIASRLEPAGDGRTVHVLETGDRELHFRLPDANDLREAAREQDARGAAQALLRRCLFDASADDLADETVDALSARMEVLAPGAHLAFALDCPDCGRAWQSALEVGDALWSEWRSAAERVLLEVDALARAYGWSESQILALSPVRRAAYLQLVGAA